MNHSASCHIKPNSVQELARDEWPSLKELLMWKNNSMKFVMNNLR